METELDSFDLKISFSPPSENLVHHEENENSYDDVKEENIVELSKLKKVEVKLTKIDDSKLLDKNENSIDDCSKILDDLINNIDEEPDKSSSTINSANSPDYFPSPTSTTPPENNLPQRDVPGPSSKPRTQSQNKTHPNGNLPKSGKPKSAMLSGKPMLSDLKRLKQRGRPKAKTVVYQSKVFKSFTLNELHNFQIALLIF